MRAHRRGIIFRNAWTVGKRLTVRCSEKLSSRRGPQHSPRPFAAREAYRRTGRFRAGPVSSQLRLTLTCSAAEFGGWNCHDRHRRHRHRLRGRCCQLHLPHCKHPRGDRADCRWFCGFIVPLACERRWPLRAIFFQIGKHEIVLRQQPVALAEFGRRRGLGRQLTFSRPGTITPGTITLRRRYVISHRLPANVVADRPCSPDRRWVKAACG